MKNEKYEIILKYKNENTKIRILGKEFVNKNKKNCKIIFKGKEKKLNSFIFNNECSSLKYLPDISKWNTSKFNNMKSMFNKCNSLLTLPDISKWYTSKVRSFNLNLVIVVN